ncbi:MAG: Stp1/IreP family PP2C-type Ser/Thr phosphatase [Selenomonadaceae bacterium]|nr:Stp1/IreP family PP2C-type Ser/Thr phosphatase [Selenomonadaceae bacterium]
MSKHCEATHTGLVRSHNEDSFAVIEPETYLVADGMGGQAAGEVASRMLVDSIRDFLSETPLPWTCETLQRSIIKAGNKIYNAALDRQEYQGMGTTATMLHLEGHQAYYAHVGDSRLYRLKNDRLGQITDDHSYVETLVRNGEISQAAARIHPMKNYLTQAVGAMLDIKVDSGSFKVDNGDVFLLCTDGLTNMVDDDAIAAIIRNSRDPAVELINAALEAGGKDNITAIVLGVV